jgi:hypothetical protein
VRRIQSVVLLVVVATSTILGGVSVMAQDEQPVSGGTIELVAGGDLANLDNSQAVNSIDYNMVAGALYEGLYHFNPRGVSRGRYADSEAQTAPPHHCRALLPGPIEPRTMRRCGLR